MLRMSVSTVTVVKPELSMIAAANVCVLEGTSILPQPTVTAEQIH